MKTGRKDLEKAVLSIELPSSTGVEALLRSLHRNPATRELVHLETTALAAVPSTTATGTALTSLLVDGTPGSNHVRPPWGSVTWDWETGELLELHRWNDSPPSPGLERAGTWLVPLELATRVALSEALDAFGPRSDEDQWAQLDDAYRAALPVEALEWYRTLVDGAGRWLGNGTDGNPPRERGASRHAVAIHTGHDLSRRLLQLAEELDAQEVMEAIHQAWQRRSAAACNVVVAGEFNRGKSTLVNTLLGRHVVPTGPVPTSRYPTRVEFGETEGIDVRWPDGRIEHRDVGDWEGLTASEDTPGVALEQARPAIVVRIAHELLDRTGIRLTDLPGLNEGSDDTAAPLLRSIARADAVVLVVSASSPLSLTEQEILEHQVVRRRTESILVVVGRLDTLADHDRDELVAQVTRRTHAIAPRAIVVAEPSALPAGSGNTEAIWQFLEHAATRSDRRRQRDDRHLLDLHDLGSELGQRLDALAAAVSMEDAEREAEAVRLADVRAQGLRTWDLARVQLQQRRLERLAQVITQLDTWRDESTVSLTRELAAAPDPRSWLVSHAQPRLRGALSASIHALEARLAAAIASDLQQLIGVLATGGVTVDDRGVEAAITMPEATWSPTEPAQSTNDRRLLYRIAAPVGTIVGALVSTAAGLPTPIIWSTAAAAASGLVAERQLSETSDELRRSCERELQVGISEVFDGYVRDVDSTLSRAYDHLLDELHDRWRRQIDATAAALRSDARTLGASSAHDLGRAQRDLQALMAAIDARLEAHASRSRSTP